MEQLIKDRIDKYKAEVKKFERLRDAKENKIAYLSYNIKINKIKCRISELKWVLENITYDLLVRICRLQKHHARISCTLDLCGRIYLSEC